MGDIRLAAVVIWAVAGGLAAPVGAQHDDATPERRDHPYLFFRQGELEELRAKFERPPQRHYLRALRNDAERAFELDPDDRENRHNHFPNAVQSMVWAYHLTGEAKSRDRALRWIKHDWDRRKFDQWSEMSTAAVAVAYDTLYPELTDEQKSEMKGYLERALDQHLENAGGWLYNNPSNTVPAQCGAAGMAALALRWESPKAAEAVKMTVGKLKRYARRSFSRDGGYIEGTLYWDFGVSHYLMFAHALHHTMGDDSLLTDDRLKKQHRFAETILGGDGEMMPFNDTQPQLYGMAVMADLGTRHDRPLLLWLADFMAARNAEGEEAGRPRGDLALRAGWASEII